MALRPVQTEFIRCPICRNKTRVQIRDDIGLVHKYTRAQKLTPRMLNELIEKLEVFNAEKIDDVWEQRLRIHYNCVGTIEIPTVLPPAAPGSVRKYKKRRSRRLRPL